MEENKNINPKQTAENIPEVEHIETPTSKEEITPSEENILHQKETIETTNTAKENDMEVHHHTHATHGKKNWKSYFWEFLMLFLAVFCGFLAEYQLEHTIEHQREKEYATLLIKDLEKDTFQISDSFKQWEKILKSIDSISSVVYKGLSGNKVQGSFYYHSQMGTISPMTVWNDATLIQLTQSGNLRYFRNHELVNKISSYYSRQSYIRSLNNGDREKRDITIAIRSRILSNYYYKYYSIVWPTDSLPFPDSLMKNMIPVQNSDLKLLNEYANSFENRKGVINLILTNTYPRAIAEARELILLLKKEFDLK